MIEILHTRHFTSAAHLRKSSQNKKAKDRIGKNPIFLICPLQHSKVGKWKRWDPSCSSFSRLWHIILIQSKGLCWSDSYKWSFPLFYLIILFILIPVQLNLTHIVNVHVKRRVMMMCVMCVCICVPRANDATQRIHFIPVCTVRTQFALCTASHTSFFFRKWILLLYQCYYYCEIYGGYLPYFWVSLQKKDYGMRTCKFKNWYFFYCPSFVVSLPTWVCCLLMLPTVYISTIFSFSAVKWIFSSLERNPFKYWMS